MVLDVSIAGDDEPIAVPRRPSVASLFDEPDPHKVLAGFAAVTTQINQRTNDLYNVLSRAADSDAAAAVLIESFRQRRDRGREQVVQALHRKQKLRAGLKPEDAADLVLR